MTAIDELLYLHPASVASRFAAEPPKPRRKRTEKPSHVAPERRLLLRLAGRLAKDGLGPTELAGQTAS